MLIALIFGIRRKKGDGRVVLSGFPRYLSVTAARPLRATTSVHFMFYCL
jgi:hypothetical protein